MVQHAELVKSKLPFDLEMGSALVVRVAFLADFLVISDQSFEVFAGFGEFALLHALANIPDNIKNGLTG
jgi:hypothetical protein